MDGMLSFQLGSGYASSSFPCKICAVQPGTPSLALTLTPMAQSHMGLGLWVSPSELFYIDLKPIH